MHQAALGEGAGDQAATLQGDALAQAHGFQQQVRVIDQQSVLRFRHAGALAPERPGFGGAQCRAGDDLARRARQAAAVEVGRGDHQQLVVEQAFPTDPFPVALADAYAEVGQALAQVLHVKTGHQPHATVRMALAKARQARQQPVQAEGRHHRDHQLTLPWTRPHHPRGVGDLAQRGAYLQGVEPAVLAQAQAAPLADEQGQAEEVFQQLDLLADR